MSGHTAQAETGALHWIEWSGGDCPVDPNAMVSVVFRMIGTPEPPDRAGDLRWSHLKSPTKKGWGDIISYAMTSRAEQTSDAVPGMNT